MQDWRKFRISSEPSEGPKPAIQLPSDHVIGSTAQMQRLARLLIYIDVPRREVKDWITNTIHSFEGYVVDARGRDFALDDDELEAAFNEAKDKANAILRSATDNAKKIAVETEELKNKTRIFHQRLKSTVESQLSLINSSEWEDLLRPTASYLQTSDEAFREVLEKALDERPAVTEEDLDMTRQLTPEELEELQRHTSELDAATESEFEEHQETE